MGVHQNPHREVSLAALRAGGVRLVRRESGGGCVYQDEGNAIFSFMQRDHPLVKNEHNEIILDALSSLGIHAEASGRNDIVTGGKKISGCAFKLSGGSILHHGTMLLDLDLNALPRLLTPSKAKLAAKGVASVAARVTNLRDIDPSIDRQKWDEALTNAFIRKYSSEHADTITLSSPTSYPPHISVESVSDIPSALATDPALAALYDHLQSWSWLYGATPSFTHEFEHRVEGWGSITVGFEIEKKHRVKNVEVHSDALAVATVQAIRQAMSKMMTEGREYSREQVAACLNEAESMLAESGDDEAVKRVVMIREWLTAQL